MTTKLLLKTYKTQIMNICPSCGNKLTDDQAKFCPRCGTKLEDLTSTLVSEETQKNLRPQTATSNEITFGIAISNFWSNYFNFSGRATRAEFWYAWLFLFLIQCAIFTFNTLSIPFSLLFAPLGIFLSTITVIWYLVAFFPFLSLHFRRFRDAGKSFGIWLIVFLGICLEIYLGGDYLFSNGVLSKYSDLVNRSFIFGWGCLVVWIIHGFFILIYPTNYNPKRSSAIPFIILIIGILAFTLPI